LRNSWIYKDKQEALFDRLLKSGDRKKERDQQKTMNQREETKQKHDVFILFGLQ
jgi:hypothetical protein